MNLTNGLSCLVWLGMLCANAAGQDVHLLVNAETGNIESGIEPPLTESYSFEPSSAVVDGQGNNCMSPANGTPSLRNPRIGRGMEVMF